MACMGTQACSVSETMSTGRKLTLTGVLLHPVLIVFYTLQAFEGIESVSPPFVAAA